MLAENRKTLPYFTLVFVLSWLLWLPPILSGLGLITLPIDELIVAPLVTIIGAFAPLIAGIIMIVRTEGGDSVRVYLKSGFDFKVKPIYIMLTLLLPLLITAGAHYTANLSGLDNLPATLLPPDLPVPVIVAAVPYFIAMFFLGGGQEEYGWRGYAQVPLQHQYGVINGSLLLGAIWGVWHLPLWFMPGDGHSNYSFIAFILMTMSFSIHMAWLYNASGRKLLVPWLYHAMSNTIIPVFPILHLEPVRQPGYWMFVGFNALVALVIAIWLMKPKV